MLPLVNEDAEQEANPMHLSEPAFLVSFTDPNKQFFNAKSAFKFINHGFSV